jgi:hypothetical protein
MGVAREGWRVRRYILNMGMTAMDNNPAKSFGHKMEIRKIILWTIACMKRPLSRRSVSGLKDRCRAVCLREANP